MATASAAMVVAARIGIVAVAAAGVVVGFTVRRGGEPAAALDGTGATFSCPMHREIVAPVPGECPVCRMALAPRRSGAPAAEVATVTLPAGTASLPEQNLALATHRRISGPITAPARLDRDRAGFALLYDGEGVAGQPARLQLASGAAVSEIDVRLSGDAAQPEGGGIVRARFAIAPTAPPIRAGETGWITFDRPAMDALTVPYAAILETPAGAFVFVASANRRTFTRRKIEIGRNYTGLAVVRSGLSEGERVVVSKGFFLAVEQQLGQASDFQVKAAP